MSADWPVHKQCVSSFPYSTGLAFSGHLMWTEQQQMWWEADFTTTLVFFFKLQRKKRQLLLSHKATNHHICNFSFTQFAGLQESSWNDGTCLWGASVHPAGCIVHPQTSSISPNADSRQESRNPTYRARPITPKHPSSWFFKNQTCNNPDIHCVPKGTMALWK